MSDPASSDPSLAAALRLVLEDTLASTGEEFFRALVRNLARAMDTAGAWVTEFDAAAGRLRARAFWMNSAYVEGYEYRVADTPCEVVIRDRCLAHFKDALTSRFPRDPDLAPLRAVSYLGVPLLDVDGSVMGHLAVIDTRPMPLRSHAVPMFELFAARAAAECRRLRAEQEVRARGAQLAAVFDGAMDAILVIDGGGAIVRVNPAATRLFGCTEEDLLGETLTDFLPAESATSWNALVAELATRPAGSRHAWLPRHFHAQRWDRTVFPAEATVSRFEDRGAAFHAVILRNVDERLAAERTIERLTAETEYLRASAREIAGMGELLGRSPAMRDLFISLERVAATNATVLITGETGTGKELIARSIHEASARRQKPLVRVNCAAIPGTLMESEFFGHERGAFTGATTRREGRFALADGGTLFLDEVGELPLDLQAKLLRVLQEGEFEPLGSTRTRKVDVRVLAATNRDLGAMVRAGRFREDLFYRLNVFPLSVPPLRERAGDVPLLARVFAERLARRMGRIVDPPDPDDLRALQAYRWPGNVRELQNVVERALILSPGPRLELARALPFEAAPPAATATATATEPADTVVPPSRILTARELAELERANLQRALAACGGKISGPDGAAHRLGLAASTLSSRLKALGIPRSG